MAGFADLLGSLMQGGMSSSGANRVTNAMGERGLGGDGGVLGQLLGGGAGGGLLGSVLSSAGSALGSAGRTVQDNPLAAGGLGALAGALFGGGSSAVSGAAGGGAMALLAGLAFKALSNRGGGGASAFAAQQPPLGLRAPADEAEEKALESNAGLMLRAMISAAKADGAIDDQEMDRVLGKVREAGADSDAQRVVMDEMRKPLDLEGLIADIPDQQVAAQVYAASLFAIEVDTPQEKEYLERLAAGCGLDDDVVAQLHAALGVS